MLPFERGGWGIILLLFFGFEVRQMSHLATNAGAVSTSFTITPT